MYSFLKLLFATLSSAGILLAIHNLKHRSLNDEPYFFTLTLIDLDPTKLNAYPFIISLVIALKVRIPLMIY